MNIITSNQAMIGLQAKWEQHTKEKKIKKKRKETVDEDDGINEPPSLNTTQLKTSWVELPARARESKSLHVPTHSRNTETDTARAREKRKMAIPIPSRQLFIDGEWKAPILNKRIPVINPSTQDIIGSVLSLSLSLSLLTNYWLRFRSHLISLNFRGHPSCYKGRCWHRRRRCQDSTVP